jgi:hypothetical protein
MLARDSIPARTWIPFITRAKQNTQFWRRDWSAVRRLSGLRSDQTIQLTGPRTSRLTARTLVEQ